MLTSIREAAAIHTAEAQVPTTPFSREQLKQALASGRVFVVPPSRDTEDPFNGALLRDFPYALLTYTGAVHNIRVADAWRIDARGMVYPGHICATPVILSEVIPFDVAPAHLRRNLLAYTQSLRERNGGFVNEPTMRVAQVLHGDAEAWEYLANAAPVGILDRPARAAKALRHFSIARRALFAPSPIALSEVDWDEVAAQFGPEPIAKSSAPVAMRILQGGAPAAPAPTIKIAAAEESQKDRAIPPDVLEVLRQSHAQGTHIHLPKVQLDRALYSNVDKVLRDLGGKWVGGSRRAHKFDVDAADILAAAIETGRYVRPADLGFFPTPALLVNRLLAKARLERGMRVIEPSGGTGNLACPMAAAVGGLQLVTVCELMERNVRKLRDAGFTSVIHGDFLNIAPDRSFSAACMNPPFSRHQDIDHVLHASRFVRAGGTVTSFMSSSWVHSSQKKAVAFNRFIEAVKADVESVDVGAFRESGTEVATTLVHFKV